MSGQQANGKLTRHPFSGSKGQRRRDNFAQELYLKQLGKCWMCKQPVNSSLRGKTKGNDVIVDHIKPWRLSPELKYCLTNLVIVCRKCHNQYCKRAETMFWPDSNRIEKQKNYIADNSSHLIKG